MNYFEMLSLACSDVKVNFDSEKYDKFIEYMNMIKLWNERVNLTAITEDDVIIKKHFIDCIKIFKYESLKSKCSIIDVGTGAGFPGIPMNIINNENKIVLLDSLNKRVNFLNEVINKLNLKNITAVHGRAEDFGQDVNYRERFDFSISRAVANLTSLSEYCLPFLKLNGKFIAMKGPAVADEINDSRNAIAVLGGSLEKIIEVNIEDSDLKHNLVIIEKIKHTPKQYPRKAGMATKKPIK
ncbi:16S rRNA (guanine(527)-N(7))-methyltransferase RsmG [Clostridium sp. JN-9]|uniref:16S rRNA (guanine(527)-N(7))-methyltransferase RsmG n=1 Tax=Clostridium sp. JN-9 TaxID=2507159 RepID=UPI000FFE00BF|nr:16S rRNA (guanine(527)-N(7))-methyltransferase RsmG [Clostridium sp. JN-9]QAT41556.1 16S rRNA (guanine(527)-N(7))-methyltransferase RsmG [Clostridium sp. JN-9]